MNASIKGALAKINKSYRAFEHKGQPMTQEQVKKVLEYGLNKGYEHTGQITDEEVDSVLLSSNFINKEEKHDECVRINLTEKIPSDSDCVRINLTEHKL